MTQPHPVIPAKHAWVDESVLVGAGLYILAAVVATPAACDDIRQMLRGLWFKNKPRLHWHEEDDARRHKIAVAIAACDVTSLVVIASPMARNGQERARRKCIERLLWQLGEMHQVGHVKFEPRTQVRSDQTVIWSPPCAVAVPSRQASASTSSAPSQNRCCGSPTLLPAQSASLSEVNRNSNEYSASGWRA